jgi:hypothetical protein
MAKMRMLGVQTSQLEKAAKATIALKSLGLEEAAAQKAVAMALQGDYEMLNRYVPALRSATTETEKATIVNDLFVKGYEQQAAQLDTVSGQWGALKGRVGDLWEEMGRAIVQSDGMKGALERAGEAVKAFTGKVSEWIDGGGVIRLVAGVKLFYNEASHIFKLIGNTASVTWAAMGDGADTLVNNIIGSFKYAAAYAQAAWKSIKTFSKFQAPSRSDYGFGIVTTQTEKALADRKKIEERYAKETADIAKEETDAIIAQQERKAEAAKKAANVEQITAKETADVVKKTTADQSKDIMTGLKDKLSAIQKEKAKVEDLAKSRVQAVIDAANADKKELADKAQDAEKARRMEDRISRGTRLGKKQQEWLDAYKSIEAAKTSASTLGAAEKAVTDQIAAAKESVTLEKKMAGSLEGIDRTLEKAISY